jgi:predicted enzyme related to lactoylglutathione lyase
MSRVVHFEIGADDPERASKFYADVFGWKINKWEGPVDYWLATTGESDEPGIDGAIMQRSKPVDTTVNTISVDSADEFMKKVAASGGKVLTDKTTVPGVGYFAYCTDTEGNPFGIMENDPEAK